MRTLRALVAATLACSATASAAPRLSSEVPLDPTPGAERLSTYAYGTAVHFNGQQFVMTWVDYRSGNSTSYGALVDVDGGVTQPGTRILADGDDFPYGGRMSGCRVGGELWFVVAGMYSGRSSRLRATPSLARVQLSSFPVGADLTYAFGCDGPAPVWVTTPTVYQPTPDTEVRVYALMGDAGIEALDGGAALIARLGFGIDADRVGTTLSWDGTRYLLAWADGRAVASLPDGGSLAVSDVYGAFLDADQGVSPEFLLAGGAGDQARPRLAFDGADHVLVWTDALAPGASRDLWARRVSPAGALGAPFPIATAPEDESDPVLAFDGSAVVTAWRLVRGFQDFELQTATLVGTSASAAASISRGYLDELALATSGAGRSLLTFRDFGRGIREVGVLLEGAVRLDDAGVIDPAVTASAQLLPHVARGPAGHAVLWAQTGTTAGALVSPGGFDGGHRVVRSSFSPPLGLAFDGTRFLALWQDLMVQRLAPDLSPVDAAPFRAAPQGNFTVTNPVWDGRSFVFALADSSSPPRLIAHAVFSDGGVEAPLAVATATTGVSDVSLAANAEGTSLLAWSGQDTVRAACLRGGTVTAGSPVPLDLGNTPSHIPRVRVASDGSGFLVVWTDRKSPSPLLYDLWALRIGPDCAVVPADAVHLGGFLNVDHFAPEVAFDGKQYVVAWVTAPEPKGDIVLRRVGLDGSVGPVLVVAGDPTTDEGQAALSPEGPGQWLVAFTRFDRDEAVSARRARFRWVLDDSLGAPCASGTECASGDCADEVCCDSECLSDGGTRRVCRASLGAPSDGVCAEPGAAGTGADGGSGEGRRLTVGCGCATPGDGLSALGWCVLVAFAVARRKRLPPGGAQRAQAPEVQPVAAPAASPDARLGVRRTRS